MPKDNEVDEKVMPGSAERSLIANTEPAKFVVYSHRKEGTSLTLCVTSEEHERIVGALKATVAELRAEVASERKLRMRAEGLFVEWKKRHDYLIDGIAAIQKTRDTAERRGEVLRNALQVLFDDYKALADSGDAGNWSLEDTDAGKVALAALTGADPT